MFKTLKRRKEYFQERRNRKKEEGVCKDCANPIAADSTSLCEDHSKHYRETRKTKYIELKKAGIALFAKVENQKSGKITCSECIKKSATK